MLDLLVEFLGSFIFFSVILKYGEALPIAIALAAVIYFGGYISGGNYNPGVSLMMFLTGKLSMMKFIQYVAVQALAAFSAVYFASKLV
jgi:aquaporin Z